jgi:hypothetical protein
MGSTAFVTAQLADRTKVVVEVAKLTPSTDTEVSLAVPDLEPIWSAVSSIASSIGTRLSQAKAKKAIVEFGIEFAVEGSGLTAVLVKGTGKANLKITLEWS